MYLKKAFPAARGATTRNADKKYVFENSATSRVETLESTLALASKIELTLVGDLIFISCVDCSS